MTRPVTVAAPPRLAGALLCLGLLRPAVARELSAQNRAPLQPQPYLRLPPGSVRGKGWLKHQLELQRDGLTGHAEQLYRDIGESDCEGKGDNAYPQHTVNLNQGLKTPPLMYLVSGEAAHKEGFRNATTARGPIALQACTWASIAVGSLSRSCYWGGNVFPARRGAVR